MGVSIDLYLYKTDELLRKLEAWGAKDRDLTVKILSACGLFSGDTYAILNNEKADEYNPYYNVPALLNAAFGGSDENDSFDIFLDERQPGISSVDVEEIADELGITLPDEED